MPTDPITSINGVASLSKSIETHKSGNVGDTFDGFGQLLGDALESLNRADTDASNAITKLAAGEDVELHQVMLAMQQADIAFNLALQVRNKLVEAYQEVMRMQV